MVYEYGGEKSYIEIYTTDPKVYKQGETNYMEYETLVVDKKMMSI